MVGHIFIHNVLHLMYLNMNYVGSQDLTAVVMKSTTIFRDVMPRAKLLHHSDFYLGSSNLQRAVRLQRRISEQNKCIQLLS